MLWNSGVGKAWKRNGSEANGAEASRNGKDMSGLAEEKQRYKLTCKRMANHGGKRRSKDSMSQGRKQPRVGRIAMDLWDIINKVYTNITSYKKRL